MIVFEWIILGPLRFYNNSVKLKIFVASEFCKPRSRQMKEAKMPKGISEST